MNIGWFTWEPGLFNDHLTSAGGGQWTRFLFDRMIMKKWKIWYMAEDNQPPDCEELELKKLDAAFFCWRWHLGDDDRYSERNALYHKQKDLILELAMYGVPTIIHDQDHKISIKDLAWLKQFESVHLYEPAIVPRIGFRRLIYPCPYYESIDARGWQHKITYIGNNYERYDLAKKYLSELATLKRAPEVHIFGNWMERSPLREPPEKVALDFLGVNFHNRLPQVLVINELKSADATIHLAKPSYNDCGFIAIRWAESYAARIIPFLPSEFIWLPELCDLYVGSALELRDKMLRAKMDGSYCKKLLNQQSDFVSTFMRADNWFVEFERITS